MRISDWSSDVCSSYLGLRLPRAELPGVQGAQGPGQRDHLGEPGPDPGRGARRPLHARTPAGVGTTTAENSVKFPPAPSDHLSVHRSTLGEDEVGWRSRSKSRTTSSGDGQTGREHAGPPLT